MSDFSFPLGICLMLLGASAIVAPTVLMVVLYSELLARFRQEKEQLWSHYREKAAEEIGRIEREKALLAQEKLAVSEAKLALAESQPHEVEKKALPFYMRDDRHEVQLEKVMKENAFGDAGYYDEVPGLGQ